MVARNPDADLRGDRPRAGLLQRFFGWWQRLLTTLVSPSKSPAERVGAVPDAPVRNGWAGRFTLRSSALTWVAVLALVAGAIATVALAPADATRGAAVAAAAMTLVWAALRWALLRATATGVLKQDPSAVRGAWALGSIVWVAGVTPELRALAWVLSGAVTWYALERVGATRRQAGVSVGIAWGVQAIVVTGSWLATNAIVAFLATRG